MCIIVSNFVETGQTFVEISRFYSLSNWRPPPSWIFKNSKFLTADTLEKPDILNPAKFRQDQPIRC